MTGFHLGRVRVIGMRYWDCSKRREPLSGDEDALNCRLALKTQVYVNGHFPKSRLWDVFCLWKRGFREGEVRREPRARDGRGKESKRERKTEEGQLRETGGRRK